MSTTLEGGKLERGWPPLPLSPWKSTYATLHRWAQIVGKVRMALSPFVNHYWHVPFYVSARGLSTSGMPCGDGILDIELDFLSHACVLRTSQGRSLEVPLRPCSVADFYQAFFEALDQLGVDVRIWPVPVEIAEPPIRFDEDRVHNAYDRESVQRFFGVLTQVDRVLKVFRSGFVGKASPVHFFWGSFDLAVTRFSGRRAPDRPSADPVTREAYSHEVSSCGFWPGGSGVEMPAFYAYASPEPAGYAQAAIEPREAFYHGGLHEFLLPYDVVRTADDPDAVLLAFCESTYRAAADLGHWDRAAVERFAPVSALPPEDRLGPTIERPRQGDQPTATGAPP